MRPNFFETDTETEIFQDQFVETDTSTLKKMKKVLIPKSPRRDVTL